MSSCISISLQAAAKLETTVVPVAAILAVLVFTSPESKKSTGAIAVNFPIEAEPKICLEYHLKVLLYLFLKVRQVMR